MTIPSVAVRAAALLLALHAPLAGEPLRPEGAPRPPVLDSKDLAAVGAAIERAERAAAVNVALASLETSVLQASHADALRLAFQAYYSFRAAHPERVRNPYLYFVDYGLDSRTPRGYVFDMERLAVVDGPFTVAHGRGSDRDGDGVPTSFSNREGSLATSLGLYLTQETYTFSGTSSGSRYRSVGLRLQGLSDGYNSAAFSRRVVAHGAPYVTPRQAGRSEGCPAMEQERAARLLPLIADGGMVFLFSPLDPDWMSRDPWALRDLRAVLRATE